MYSCHAHKTSRIHSFSLFFAAVAQIAIQSTAATAEPTETCHLPFEASQQSIKICDLGVLEGGESSFAKAISDDGSVVVGVSGSAEGERAFFWSQTDGMVNLGTLPGGTRSHATDVSSNGRVIVGTSNSSDGWHSFIWTEETGMRVLKGSAELKGFSASAVSGDGKTVVGYVGRPIGGQSPAYWNANTGVVLLDPNSEFRGGAALGVDYAGNVIVGRTHNRAFRWTASQGVQLLSTGENKGSIAYDVSSNGDIIVGYFNGRKRSLSAQWVANGAATPIIAEFDGAQNKAKGISSDGLVIVGEVEFDDRDHAYVKHSNEKVIILGDLKPYDGNFQASDAIAISTDGKVVAGTSSGPNGHRAVRWVLD